MKNEKSPNSENNLNQSLVLNQFKDKHLVLENIVKSVEKGTFCTITELKDKYSKESFFYVCLQHVTTTKKALCTALGIGIDNACRYKRKYELDELLVQSIDKLRCPLTNELANYLSTNPSEFAKLRKSNTNQTKLDL